MTVREDLLDEAKQYVSKDRNSTYDSPENNFGRIADIMNVMGYRKVTGWESPDGPEAAPIEGHDVALMMMAVKLARLAHSPDHKDSWVDTAGYAACGYDALLALRARMEEEGDDFVPEGGLPDTPVDVYKMPEYPRTQPLYPVSSDE